MTPITLRPPSSAHRPWYIPGGSIISHYSSGRCQIYCSFSYLAPSYVGTVAPKPCVTAVVPLIACVSCVAHRHRDLVGSANVFCPLRTISRGQRRSFMMHRKNHYPHPLTRPIFSRVSFGLYMDGTMIPRSYKSLIQRYSGPSVSPATYLQEKHTRPSSLLAPTGYDYFTLP